ncbi:MAG: hypothetical protein J5I50_02880 [Chitinophagaceae bacterium]|nr:hypothetical protein [Chitinophagaceae bacterium]
MKQLKNIAILLSLAVFAFSCEKHVLKYDAEDATGLAEYQLHYFVPVVAGTANNIYRVEINGEVVANASAPLFTYNAIPSGSVGRFYTVKPGTINIKLYKGTNEDLVYDKNCNVTAGKQNIFVYDFDKEPIVFDNGYPYEPIVTEHTGTTGWVKFYNFLFETGNTPVNFKLQYQYQYTVDNSTGQKSDWLNVGDPVAFGETTGWVPLPVNKTVELSSGSARIDYRAQVINPDGSDGGLLQVGNGSGTLKNYTDWWTLYVGRRFHHVLSGYRDAVPTCAVRQFTAL